MQVWVMRWPLTSLSFSVSFWLFTPSCSHMNLADISPRSGVVMIGTCTVDPRVIKPPRIKLRVHYRGATGAFTGSNGSTHAASTL